MLSGPCAFQWMPGGDLSADMANAAAKEAFIHWVSDKEAAFITMSQNPDTLDDALAFLKQVIHDKKSLARGESLLQRWHEM